MSMRRRKFLNLAVNSSISLPFLTHEKLFSLKKPKNKYMENLGLALYTVRNELVMNPMNTLQTISNLGYKQVENFDVHLLRRMKPALDNLGLNVSSSHFTGAFLTGNWDLLAVTGVYKPNNYTLDNIVEDAAEYGLEYLVMPYLFPSERDSLEKCQQFAEKMNRLGEQCKEVDVQLCFHNHASDFKALYDDGTVPFDVFLKEFEPDLVKFELDVFWLKVAGFDPAEKIKEFSGRVKLLHLKDKAPGIPKVFLGEEQFPQEAFQPVGKGELDFKSILEAAEKAGVEYCFVEQDASPNPLDSIGESIRYIKTLDK